MQLNAKSKIIVIGGGYVGLPTAAMLAKFGHLVTVAEIDDWRLDLLRVGKSPHFEEGLDSLLAEGLKSGCLAFTDSAVHAVVDADFIVICLPTPQSANGSTDLSFVTSVIEDIAPRLQSGSTVILKSTVPVGTNARVRKLLAREDVSVVSNPEFLRAGCAVADTLHPERLVIGANREEDALRVANLFADTASPVFVTDPATAEVIKYAANSFLAIKLSFINEISRFCDYVGADIMGLLEGLSRDHRIGSYYMQPGPGWGGSCLPKDTAALISIAGDLGIELPLLASSIVSNNDQVDFVVKRVLQEIDHTQRPIVGIWGLAFKAGTDDRRSSPAVRIARQLVESGITVRGYDPTLTEGMSLDLRGIEIAQNPYEAVRDAAIVILLTEWQEFQDVDWSKVVDVMSVPLVFDVRHFLNIQNLRDTQIRLIRIGTPTLNFDGLTFPNLPDT